MRETMLRAAVFGGTVFVVLLIADFLTFVVFAGGPSTEHRSEQLLAHGTFHGAVIVLTVVGAFIGFLPLRHRTFSRSRIATMGVVFALISFFAIFASFQVGGLWAAVVWLLVGSVLVCVGGSRIGNAHG
jgi:hypothetical protein